MRKELFLSTFAICFLVAIASVLFSSCKEEEEKLSEIRYPEDISYEPYDIEQEEGCFLQNADGSWHFIFDSQTVYQRGMVCNSGNVSIIENMPEEYKSYEGKVRISGTLQFEYTKVYLPTKTRIGSESYVHKLKISSIQAVEQNAKTRAVNERMLGCGVPATKANLFMAF